ncbi:NAD-dependent epimerase/dehydratase family protein [Roseibacillus ishigakijimensis]|uniref:NAD-dependent epimerase/dehydratase family protein n=1 Tax=Roseibacillus ishigakijimensis TaxID=454146 RepID=A0A934RUR8_9BACT|nr:NAD-dependent epimerase/dehydratase family protein [Roseibacillus ishigakijimensis]MBK1834846.1 NAD-dependent epimerase/dehydratase family protein [Roseibacillus ishigakijimensis]
MRVLVTGSEGFIGKHVVRVLREEGHEVLELDRLHPKDPQDLRTVDLSSYPCEGIIHLAATSAVARCEEDAVENWEQNVLLTQRVARHAAAVGAKLVFASSAAVYGASEGLVDEQSPVRAVGNYGLAKLLSEQIVRAWAPRWAILRYFNVFGPGQKQGLHALLVAAKESFVVYGDGLQTRDFIAVKEVAEMTAWAATSRWQGVSNVCSGRGQRVKEVIVDCRPDLELQYEAPRPGEIRHSVGRGRGLLGQALVCP